MRKHGLRNFPNPVDGHVTLTPASGIDPASPQFQAASQACASLAPSGGPASAAGAGDPAASMRDTTSAARWRAFGAWLKQRADQGQFSGAVLVAHNGEPLLQAGFGMADRKAAIPITPQTMAANLFDDRAEEHVAVVAVQEPRARLELQRLSGDQLHHRVERARRVSTAERHVVQAGGHREQVGDRDVVGDRGAEAGGVSPDRVVERELVLLD